MSNGKQLKMEAIRFSEAWGKDLLVDNA